MNHTTFSLGDLTVRRLGFGAMRVTGAGVWGPPADRDGAIATLRRAVELGVNLIDTAESYGPHVSEELIAEALHPYPADLVIATKGGYDRPGPDQWTINCRPERLREELDGSLKRLRVDRIDLYQLHRIDTAIPEDEQFGFLADAQRAGQIRHVGLSEVGVEQIQQAQRFFPVVSVQNRYSVSHRQWEAVAAFCDAERIGFMPWHPLEAGQLAERGVRRMARKLLGSRNRIADALARIAQRHDATPSQIALAWLLARSPVMLPIPGTSRRAHLEENMRAADISLSADDLSELE